MKRFATTISIVTIGVAAAGCGSDEAPSTASAPTVTATKAVASPADLLRKVVVGQNDLLKDYTIELAPKGDKVKGETTLDWCGSKFATEQHRVARRQVRIMTAGKWTGVTNEVVVYDSPAQAAKALKEFRTAVSKCRPKTWVKDPAPGEPSLRWDSSRLASDPGLPVQDNVVAHATLSAKGVKGHLYGTLFWQREGAVLNGVALVGPISGPDADAAVREVAIATGQRLASAA